MSTEPTTDDIIQARREVKARGATYATIAYTANGDGTFREEAVLDDGTTIVEPNVPASHVLFRGLHIANAGFAGEEVNGGDTLLWASPEVVAFRDALAAEEPATETPAA